MDTNTNDIIHNREAHRFELTVHGYTAVLNYIMMGEIIIFTHTEVPPAIEKRGFGSMLVKAGLEYAREHRVKVRSLCWFASSYIRKHPEYQDLL